MPLKKSASEDGYETVMIAFVLTAKFGKKWKMVKHQISCHYLESELTPRREYNKAYLPFFWRPRNSDLSRTRNTGNWFFGIRAASKKRHPCQTKSAWLAHGGVAQWTSHPSQEQKTRVQIPPGYKVFGENIATLFCVIDLIYIVCVSIWEIKAFFNLLDYVCMFACTWNVFITFGCSDWRHRNTCFDSGLIDAKHASAQLDLNTSTKYITSDTSFKKQTRFSRTDFMNIQFDSSLRKTWQPNFNRKTGISV
jgi:hypothetical protein